MSNIPISLLPEISTISDSHYLAVDDGMVSSKITVGNFNESASSTAQYYAGQAATSAQNASDSRAIPSFLFSIAFQSNCPRPPRYRGRRLGSAEFFRRIE